MSNFSKLTLVRIGRLIGGEDANAPPPLAALADAAAFGRKALHNWTLPESDQQFQKMPASAKRMVATLAYFSIAGLLDQKRVQEIMVLESIFESEVETGAILRRVKRLLGTAKAAPIAGSLDGDGPGDGRSSPAHGDQADEETA